MVQTKAFDAGYDAFTLGTRDIMDNPYPDGTTRALDWKNGYKEAQRVNSLEEQEHFTDIIN